MRVYICVCVFVRMSLYVCVRASARESEKEIHCVTEGTLDYKTCAHLCEIMEESACVFTCVRVGVLVCV